MKALHKKVDAALARVGVAPDQRAFLPHITLARLKRGAGPGRQSCSSNRAASPARPSPSTHFALFESDLTPEGAVYSIVERYPLG